MTKEPQRRDRTITLKAPPLIERSLLAALDLLSSDLSSELEPPVDWDEAVPVGAS